MANPPEASSLGQELHFWMLSPRLTCCFPFSQKGQCCSSHWLPCAPNERLPSLSARLLAPLEWERKWQMHPPRANHQTTLPPLVVAANWRTALWMGTRVDSPSCPLKRGWVHPKPTFFQVFMWNSHAHILVLHLHAIIGSLCVHFKCKLKMLLYPSHKWACCSFCRLQIKVANIPLKSKIPFYAKQSNAFCLNCVLHSGF